MKPPVRPPIPEAYLDFRNDLEWVLIKGERCRRYIGPIEVGLVFAWEPDSPTARELVIVCQIDDVPGDERRIWTLHLDSPMRGNPDRWRRAISHLAREVIDGAPVWNDESRFREAVVQTLFKPQNP